MKLRRVLSKPVRENSSQRGSRGHAQFTAEADCARACCAEGEIEPVADAPRPAAPSSLEWFGARSVEGAFRFRAGRFLAYRACEYGRMAVRLVHTLDFSAVASSP